MFDFFGPPFFFSVTVSVHSSLSYIVLLLYPFHILLLSLRWK